MARGAGGGHHHSHDHGSLGGHDHNHGGHATDRDFETGELADSENGRTRAPQAEINLAEVRANQRKLRRATTFVLIFFVVEIIGGIWSGSLAIISDAAHLLADVSGFILAILASEIAAQPACDKMTYGPVRAEVLSALVSTVIILLLSLLLVYSAIVRIIAFSKGEGEDIDGRLMSLIALMGLCVNIALLGILGHDHAGHDHSHGHSHGHDDVRHEVEKPRSDDKGGPYPVGGAGDKVSLVNNMFVNDGGATVQTGVFANEEADVGQAAASRSKPGKTTNINMDAAVLHAITDLIQSFGVLVAGLLIWYNPRWKWADPITTLFFVALVIHSTRQLLQRAFNVLLEAVPESINYDRLRIRLSEIDGVTDLHCLHVWSLTLGRTVVSAHIKATDPERVLASAHEICEDMGVAHSTIQVQKDHCLPASCNHPCVSAVGSCCGPDGAVLSPTPAAGGVAGATGAAAAGLPLSPAETEG